MAPPDRPDSAVPYLAGWRVLVTRPATVADTLCAALKTAGADVHCVPMVAIDALLETAADRALAQALDQFYAVIFTSRHAVQYGVPRLAPYWPQWPVGVHWLAVGAATATALATHNIVAQAPVDARSEGLLALPILTDVADRRVLLVTGVGGRGLLEDTLTARGARVARLESYRRVAVGMTTKNVAGVIDSAAAALLTTFRDLTAAPGRRAVLVTSMEILRNLLAGAPWLTAADVVLIVASERIAVAARMAGVRCVINAGSADDTHLLAALAAANRISTGQETSE